MIQGTSAVDRPVQKPAGQRKLLAYGLVAAGLLTAVAWLGPKAVRWFGTERLSDEVLRQSLLPFYTTKTTGTGVGLPLCREIVEAQPGVLRIQSREAEGTTVTIWLPAGP